MGLRIAMDFSHYRATVHRDDCPMLAKAACPDAPLPFGVKVRLCGWCRPSETEVRSEPPDVSWNPYSHYPGVAATFVSMDFTAAEIQAAQRSLGYGRRQPERNGWED